MLYPIWPLCRHQLQAKSCDSCFACQCFFFHSPCTVQYYAAAICTKKNNNNSESGFIRFSTGDSPIWKERSMSVRSGPTLTATTLTSADVTYCRLCHPCHPKTLLVRTIVRAKSLHRFFQQSLQSFSHPHPHISAELHIFR